jgi:SAM-dependent methyltransferase
MKLNVGCGTHYAKGWHNTDVWSDATTKPDEVVDPADPLGSIPDDSCERVNLSHVLEHIPWADVHGFLLEVCRVLAPGGVALVTGPDVYRTITRWRDGVEPWFMVEGTLEDDRNYQPGGSEWSQARHWWNCHERRLLDAVAAVFDAHAIPPEDLASWQADDWPLVAIAPWWCGVVAR